jgi:excisionase family DNA binding protein
VKANEPSEPDFLTVADVAKLLRVSKPTVMRAVEAQGLPVIRLGARVVRFARTDIEAWLEHQAKKKGGGRGGRAA